MRQDEQVDFAMRYDRWYRPLATFLGMGPKRTMIRLDGDALHVKHGWMFRIDVPLTYIKSAHLITARPLAWGIHPMDDAWMVNGSRDGIVELKFAHPGTSKSVKLMSSSWGEVRTLYLSLADPDSFIAALKSHI
jgi:hypothetical protein